MMAGGFVGKLGLAVIGLLMLLGSTAFAQTRVTAIDDFITEVTNHKSSL